MYIVKLINDNIVTEIHGEKEKLKSGSVVKGINSIDSFSFSILPANIGFEKIRDYKTLVTVFNTNKNRYEFYGRVLYSNTSMDSSGLISKEVTCESYLGFLCDSQQKYMEEQNWTVTGLLQHIVNIHNAQVEEYKQFMIGEVTVSDPNNNLYLGIQRENSWKTLEEKLVKKLGGEIRFRVQDGVTYLDYLTKIGETRATTIELSKNMKAISKEKDPTSIITRLIPLGSKLTIEETTTDEEGNESTETIETEERLEITEANDGKNYIDDEIAISEFGIRVGYVEYDDVTEASNLLAKGREWLIENNKVQVKYSVTALDLSLLGLDIDDFDVCNYHPIKNTLIGVDDIARIIKKTINVCEEIQSSFEIGDNFKTLSDIQIEQAGKVDTVTQAVGKIESDYVTNEALRSESQTFTSLIEQATQAIFLSIEEVYAQKTNLEEVEETIRTELGVLSSEIVARFTTATEEITKVDGELQSRFEEIRKEIVASDEGLVIRSNNNLVSLELDNEDGIVFRRNGVPFGRWDGENFYTGNIVIEVNERAQFGSFAYVPRSDGSLMFLKVGE